MPTYRRTDIQLVGGSASNLSLGYSHRLAPQFFVRSRKYKYSGQFPGQTQLPFESLLGIEPSNFGLQVGRFAIKAKGSQALGAAFF